MPRVCTICSHAQRAEIDRALARDDSNRRIASHYGLVETSVRRHRADHLPARLVKAAEQTDVRNAINVVEQLKAINGAAFSVLKSARDSGDGDLALKAIDRIQKQIELQAKLLDMLQDGDTVNIMINPQWVQMRTLIFGALAHHPDARYAVAAALQSVEAGDDANAA
jgi:hypothetical protein